MLLTVKNKFEYEIKRRWFNVNCKDILSTPPIEPKGNQLLILSMVRHTDIIMAINLINKS